MKWSRRRMPRTQLLGKGDDEKEKKKKRRRKEKKGLSWNITDELIFVQI